MIVHACVHSHTHTHSIAGVVVVVVDVFPPQVTGANGSCAGAEEDTLINTHHNNKFVSKNTRTRVAVLDDAPKYKCHSSM